MRPALPLAAILLLAGCFGGGTDDPAATVGGGRIDQATGDRPAEAAEGNGEIQGRVLDDVGLPVADALVSLLGTELSTSSDGSGAFRFTNVTPGTHGLRVLAQSIYRVHEGRIEVEAGRVTVVTVTLVPLDDRGPGYRPHLHDYWGDLQELPLMLQELDWSRSAGCGSSFQAYPVAGQVVTGAYQPNNSNWWMCFGIPQLDPARPPIVLPGTGQLRFTLTWDDDVDVDRFILSYRSVDMDPGKWVDLEPLEHGGTATFDVKPEMTDNGHQMFSLWQFRIKPAPRTAPMTILGLITVEGTMLRGELGVDPPHEDFWGGNTSLTARAWETPHGGITLCCNNFHITLAPDPERLIPPGTSTLSLRFGAVSNRAPGTPHDMDWDLLVKPANLPPGAPFSEYRPLTPASAQGGVKTYLVEVAPGETDAFYQTQSNWRFAIRQAGTDLPEALAEYEHRFSLEVIANKDPAYR